MNKIIHLIYKSNAAGKNNIFSIFSENALDSMFRDASIKTNHIILRVLNAVTGFSRWVCPKTGIICIFREYHYPCGSRHDYKAERRKEREKQEKNGLMSTKMLILNSQDDYKCRQHPIILVYRYIDKLFRFI